MPITINYENNENTMMELDGIISIKAWIFLLKNVWEQKKNSESVTALESIDANNWSYGGSSKIAEEDIGTLIRKALI